MPIIVPFLVGAARVAGTVAVKRVLARKLKQKVATKIEKGFPKQPKVETIQSARTRQKLRFSRRKTKEALDRMQRQQREQDQASANLVQKVARDNKRFEEGLQRELGDLVKSLRKSELKASIITGRGSASPAAREFNKAATRELLKIIKGRGGL